ncbi:MAG: hypothetical protein QM704_25500 [Anaeromyxobacteraceae bacterium]
MTVKFTVDPDGNVAELLDDHERRTEGHLGRDRGRLEGLPLGADARPEGRPVASDFLLPMRF